ncbi:MAG: TadE/TadG family type IV pilus assembly protein [Chloroflexota bacterium]
MKPIRNQKEKGQSLVEFALSLPVLMLLLSGLLDFGRAYYTFIALEEAAAEAALYYAIEPACPVDANPGVLDDCDDPNNALYRAKNSGSGEFDPADTEWNIETANVGAVGWADSTPDDCTSIGCSVLVQVTYPFELLTPGMRFFIGDEETITLRTQASQIIVYDQ